jgi:TRAP-type C4-dicarboxylate transport system permease large subunit
MNTCWPPCLSCFTAAWIVSPCWPFRFSFFYKTYRPRQLWRILIKALNESSMILMIMAAALVFAWVSSDLYATQALGELLLKLPLGKWGIIVVINILLLILGCFIPPAAVILMVAPLLLPIIQGLGFDPVWFAVIIDLLVIAILCIWPQLALWLPNKMIG